MVNPASENVFAPIEKTVVVGLSIQDAFRLFVEGFGKWWPLKSLSVFGDDAATCIIESKVGGRIYEVHKDGQQQSEWGRVKTWEPPRRLIFSFYPGRAPTDATEVEITFKPAPGRTRVTLIHRGWEYGGPEVQARYSSYATGWDFVLGHYVSASE
jgi:uncharacterized protein YndB with AHSA1/START domain